MSGLEKRRKRGARGVATTWEKVRVSTEWGRTLTKEGTALLWASAGRLRLAIRPISLHDLAPRDPHTTFVLCSHCFAMASTATTPTLARAHPADEPRTVFTPAPGPHNSGNCRAAGHDPATYLLGMAVCFPAWDAPGRGLPPEGLPPIDYVGSRMWPGDIPLDPSDFRTFLEAYAMQQSPCVTPVSTASGSYARHALAAATAVWSPLRCPTLDSDESGERRPYSPWSNGRPGT